MDIRRTLSAGLCLAALAAQSASAAAPPRRVLMTIKSLESDTPAVEGYFNPKEITVDKAVPWKTDPGGTESEPIAQFGGPGPTSLAVTLTLDDKTDIRPAVQNLLLLAKIDRSMRRPPMITVTWGGGLGPSRFEGVVESVSQKYTLFLESGVPVRAVVNFKVREAKGASVGRPCQTEDDCQDGYVCLESSCVPR